MSDSKAVVPAAAAAAGGEVFVTVHYMEFKGALKVDKTARVALPVTTRSPVCDLKRAMHKIAGVHPTQQRLKLIGAVDAFKIPAAVRMTRRPARDPTWQVTVEGLNSYEDEKRWRWTLTCDPTDTVLDLKFWLSEKLAAAPAGAAAQVPAEHIQLFARRTGEPVHAVLANGSDSLVKLGLKSGAVLKVQYVVPSAVKGHGDVHRSEPALVAFDDPANRTVCSNFRLAVKQFPNRQYLGTRAWPAADSKSKERGPYQWATYAQVGARVSAVGAGLRALGLRTGETVGIMSVNRAEWVITDLACATQSLLSVPLYDTLGPDATGYIVNHASVRAVVVSREKLGEIASVRAACPTLEFVVVMNDAPADKQFVAATDRKSPAAPFTHTFDEVERLGAAHSAQYPDVVPQPSDLVTICYTSGTTGNPKGVMLTHTSILSAALAISNRLPKEAGAVECMLSYLPLAHIYERVVECSITARGHAIGFYAGDTAKLVDDVAVLRPTIFPGVPRVWQRVYDRVNAQVADGNAISRYLFAKGYAAKQAAMRRGEDGTTPYWDKIVFSKVAQKFGGNLKVMASGAAPLSPKIAEFMHLAFVSGFAEGYGLTETCGGCTASSIKDVNFGCVGAPIACSEVKLVDCPEQEYLTTDRPHPRGEIWIRGPNVFSGYYKQPDVTAEMLDADGWFRTGDVGLWLPSGDLKIIDRKKNIFKTQQGEYIRPEYIEGVYKQCTLVANVFVYGSGLENYLVAVVVPNADAVAQWCNANGLAAVAKAGPVEMAKNDKVRRAILKAMTAVAEQEKLRGFELVKDIHLTADDFTVENGLLTPSFKLKRHQCTKVFADVLAAMYTRTNAELAKAPTAAAAAAAPAAAADDKKKPIKSKL